MDVAARYKIPMVSGISTAPGLTERGNPYYFRIQATSQMLSNAFGPTMMKDVAGKKVAFLVVNDDWGRSVATWRVRRVCPSLRGGEGGRGWGAGPPGPSASAWRRPASPASC